VFEAKSTIKELEEKAGFTDTGVTDDNKFEDK
jgi:hypothetical protein